MTSKFKAQFLNVYISEIFGNKEMQEPLLLKNISQKTKFGLKKLGTALQVEYKAIMEKLQEMFNEYSEEVVSPLKEDAAPDAVPETRKVVKEEFREQFLKETKELEDLDIEVSHQDFEEKDFIDKSTGDIVASNNYYNLLDILVFEKEEVTKKAELEAV
jgi:hypothetical protein